MVVVQDAGPVRVSARGDQEVRWRCGSVVAAAGEFALRDQRCVLDMAVDHHARQSQQIGEQLVVMRSTPRRPAGFQQERSTDGNLSTLDHRGDLGAACVRQQR